MDGFIRPLAYAARRLRQQPRFTAAVVLTLALGLGANLTVFTFLDAFVISALPVPSPQELIRIGERRDGRLDITSYPTYRDTRDSVAEAVDLAAHVQTPAQFGEADGAHMGTAELVTGNYFRVLQLVPQLGRLLDEGDDQAELADPVAVVSDRYWRQRLGGPTSVTGRTIRINNATFDIVGVAPAGFGGTFAAHQVDVWVPVTMQQYVRPRGLTLDRRNWGWLRMIGRMRPPTSMAQATRVIDRAAEDLNRRFPPARESDAVGFVVVPATALGEQDAAALTPMLTVAFAFTGLLFLATCANLAGIMHSRLASRRRELAIRQSLGAGRWRLAGEWLVECQLLALLGGAAALVVARATAGALGTMDLPAELVGGLSLEATMGWRVVAYAFGLSAFGALCFGASTAWRAGRHAPLPVLKAADGPQAGGADSSRTRRLTVTIQVASSVVLLVVAGLFSTSLSRHAQADPGFDADRLGVMAINLQRQRAPREEWAALTARAIGIARQVPGVTAAAVAMRPALALGQDVQSVRIPGYTPPDGAPTVRVDFNQVSAGYFAALGLGFTAGAPWELAPGGSPSVVINETMARAYWPEGDAVGRAITVGATPGTVAGVVADSAYYEIGEAPRPMLYLPAEVTLPGGFALHVRTDGDPAAVAAAVARALAAADARLTPTETMAFSVLRQVSLFPTRLLAASALVFGAVSVLLTAVGLYGVIASSVGSRTREIGVRLALGAAPAVVQRAVLGEALKLVVLGGVAGGFVGYGAARALQDWLYAVAPFDATIYAGVLAFVGMLAAVSAWLPARRAARVDPAMVLR